MTLHSSTRVPQVIHFDRAEAEVVRHHAREHAWRPCDGSVHCRTLMETGVLEHSRKLPTYDTIGIMLHSHFPRSAPSHFASQSVSLLASLANPSCQWWNPIFYYIIAWICFFLAGRRDTHLLCPWFLWSLQWLLPSCGPDGFRTNKSQSVKRTPILLWVCIAIFNWFIVRIVWYRRAFSTNIKIKLCVIEGISCCEFPVWVFKVKTIKCW